MKIFLYCLNRIISFVLILLGLSNCFRIERDLDEYGCPSADFIFKGKVVDENGTPLPEVSVSSKIVYSIEPYPDYPAGKKRGRSDTYTDSNGVYADTFVMVDPGSSNYLFKYHFQKVGYEDVNLFFDLSESEYSGGEEDSWYKGCKITNVMVEMNQKQKTEK